MNTYVLAKRSGRRTIPALEARHQFLTKRKKMVFIALVYLALMIYLLSLLSGCSSIPDPVLPTHFQSDPQGLSVFQGERSGDSERQKPIGMALVTSFEDSKFPEGMTQDSWGQFAASVKHKIQDRIPGTMQDFIHLDGNQPLKQEVLFEGFNGKGRQAPVEIALVVLPSSREVKAPAKFDLLPEVSMLNGYQIENHATVELGLLDLKSGKLLWHSQGSSYAVLEQLDTPLESNRYPRVRGSDLVNPVYPEESRALETLRVVALNEALDQAILKLSSQWPKG